MRRKLVRVITIIIGLLLAAVLAAGCASQTTTPIATTPTIATQPPEPTHTTLPTLAPTETAAPTHTVPPTAKELSGDMVRGGLLYDKWWAVLGADVPQGDMPLWKTQTTNTRSGEDTWRCKECHGWDYKGVDGAYGSGSHMTGFKGILGAQEKTAAEILLILKGGTNPDHDFSQWMEEQALVDLALFIDQALMDTSTLVMDDKATTGDSAKGEEKFKEVCAHCHGPQGSAINFGDLEEPEFVGHIAADNPWEFIHKVRFGAPGWPMPSSILNGWADQEVADVMAFSQSLSNDIMVSAGGQLYDKWWTVLGADVPQGDMPLWKTQTTNTRSGEDTWRCKECHGWDYKGVDGAYGSGSHMTGFKGILGAASMSSEELSAWLTGKTNPEHDFSQWMSEAAINALIKFVQTEAKDTASIIKSAEEIVGDSSRGQQMFMNTCAACHGEDGKKINFGDADEPEYLGTIAAENPWEFIHKASFGQPGQPMPAGVALGWTLEQLGDLLVYAATLPTR